MEVGRRDHVSGCPSTRGSWTVTRMVRTARRSGGLGMISRIPLKSVLLLCCLLTMVSLAMPASAGAQIGLVPPANTANAQAGAPFDLSGYWVAVVTEDWR